MTSQCGRLSSLLGTTRVGHAVGDGAALSGGATGKMVVAGEISGGRLGTVGAVTSSSPSAGPIVTGAASTDEVMGLSESWPTVKVRGSAAPLATEREPTKADGVPPADSRRSTAGPNASAADAAVPAAAHFTHNRDRAARRCLPAMSDRGTSDWGRGNRF